MVLSVLLEKKPLGFLNTPSSRPFLYLAGQESIRVLPLVRTMVVVPAEVVTNPDKSLDVRISLPSFVFTLFLVPLVENLCAVPEALRRRCLLVDPWW